MTPANPTLRAWGATPPYWFNTTALIRIEVVCRSAANLYGVDVAVLFARTRVQPAVQARQLAMAVLRASGITLLAIGRTFAGRDHGTVIHACRCVARRRSADPVTDLRFRNLLSLASTPA
jgi:chromosomal replication initiation ATPase DnaA